MPSEQKRIAWQAKAEQIHHEVVSLRGLQQSEIFRERLDQIKDEHARSAVELMVWSWIREGETPKTITHNELFSTNKMLVATFVTVFLIGWFELGMSPIWAGALALVTTVIVRIVFRLFDRSFMFRRLFIACISSGLFLIAPAQLQFAFETHFGTISWGGSPGDALVSIWLISTMLTFVAAVWEHFASERA